MAGAASPIATADSPLLPKRTPIQNTTTCTTKEKIISGIAGSTICLVWLGSLIGGTLGIMSCKEVGTNLCTILSCSAFAIAGLIKIILCALCFHYVILKPKLKIAAQKHINT